LAVSRIAVQIEIDAPVDRVWAEVEPIERHVEWMHDAVAIRFRTEQRRGPGTEFLCDTRVGPFKLVDRMEITEWAAPSRMGVRHSGLVTGTGTFVLTSIDLDRRTRFAWTEDLHFPWWMGGPIGERIGGNLAMKAIWRRNLRNLKRLIEN
jgi:Polyketide cyclase / dehydrase and lipid transport